MNEKQLELTILELKRSSKASLLMVILGAFCVLGSMYYSATRLTPLEKEISKLTDKSTRLKLELDTKQHQLEELNKKLSIAEKSIEQSTSSLQYLEGGTRSLLNRQYEDAIEYFYNFLVIHPSSAEGLNLLGYSELRFSQYWKAASKSEKSHLVKLQHERTANSLLTDAEMHLNLASEKDNDFFWPDYNLSLLYLSQGNLDKSLLKLENSLKKHPLMIKFVCEDGQFRKLKLNRLTSIRFSSAIKEALSKQNIESCWVIKDPVR